MSAFRAPRIGRVRAQRGSRVWRTVARALAGLALAVAAGPLAAQSSWSVYISADMEGLTGVGTPAMTIEVGPQLELNPTDTVLLGTDGLFDNLHLEEILGTIRESGKREDETREKLTADIESFNKNHWDPKGTEKEAANA